MNYLFKACLILVLSISPRSTLIAQIPSDSKQPSTPAYQEKNAESRKITEQQEQAILLLKQLFVEAKETLRNETRIKTQARIAALLWNYDEKNARQQFAEAFASIEKISDEESPFAMLGSENTRLRYEILREVVTKDPALAESLINSLPESQPSSNSPSLVKSKKGKLYLELARHLISTQPQRAATLIQKDFVNGFSVDLMATLGQLRRKDKALATGLMRRALAEIQLNSTAPLADLMAIGTYFSFADNEELKKKTEQQQTDEPSIDSELIEPFLDFVYKAILQQAELDQKRDAESGRKKRMAMFDIMNVAMVAGVLPLFEQYQPDRAGFIRSHLNQIETKLPASTREAMSEYRPQTAKDLLEKAEKESDPSLKDWDYLEAVEKALEETNFDLAIAIASKIKDKSLPGLSYAYESAASKSAHQGNIETAYKYASRIPAPLSRAESFCRIACKALEKGDTQRAGDLLSEAEKLLIQTADERTASAFLDLSAVFSRIDPVRGFESLRQSVDFINKNSSKRYDSLERYWDEHNDGLRLLAKSDFYRTLSLARSITPKNILLLAQFSVCEGLLQPQQTTNGMKKVKSEGSAVQPSKQ